MSADLGIGVAGALGAATIGRIARAAEHAGFASLWVNDTPGGDALEGLAAAAAETSHLLLGTGVIPIDRSPASAIATRVADLPAERLRLGIGSGAARSGQLDLVRAAIDELRGATTVRILVGALGPRMRRLGAEHADGILLNWLDPTTASEQTREAHGIDADARVALYARTALDAAAVPRLREETARYAGLPSYAANFVRLELDPSSTVLSPEDAAERLPEFRSAVDELVLRTVTPTDAADDYARFIAAAAALAGR